MVKQNFVLKGDICYSPSLKELKCVKNGYLVCKDGICEGVFEKLLPEYIEFPLIDCSGMLVVPGMVDLHIHAPQFTFRGMGMDLELLDWLKTYTFPEETKYADVDYSRMAYREFAHTMKNSATTRAVVFATVHREATVMLMDLLEETGLITYVGKVNMDSDAPDDLREESAEISAFDTVGWLEDIEGRYVRTKPIITPRFLPSCSEKLLNELKEIREKYDLPVQSHLSENPDEVALVKKLFPKAAFYGDGYDRYGLFGKEAKTVMAHCVYCTDDEVERIYNNGVFVAHCPTSNMNLSSGIAPIRRFLEKGIKVGLGTDVGAGECESVFRAIGDTIQVSKLYWRMASKDCAPLSFAEAFYLATAGGGEFFGKVGKFEKGFEFDAVVVDDYELSGLNEIPIISRLERAIYLEADNKYIYKKYVGGNEIDLD